MDHQTDVCATLEHHSALAANSSRTLGDLHSEKENIPARKCDLSY